MSVSNEGKTLGEGRPWTQYAFVSWSDRRQNWTAAQHLKGPNGKAKLKSFSTEMAAAVHVAEQAVLVGYVHPTISCLPTANGRASHHMSPFDASHWVRFLLCSFFRLKNSFSPNLFQSTRPGVYGPLTEEQVLELSPDHEGGGAVFLCSPEVLKELGLHSFFVPYKPIFRGTTSKWVSPCACNICGAIFVDSCEVNLKHHLASLQHVALKERALARPDFTPAPITDESRRLDWVG
jgi:hypothetical protein